MCRLALLALPCVLLRAVLICLSLLLVFAGSGLLQATPTGAVSEDERGLGNTFAAR